MKCLRIFLLAVGILPLFISSFALAQDDVGLIRFGQFLNEPVFVGVDAGEGLSYDTLPPNVLTKFSPVKQGELTIEYVAPAEGAAPETLPEPFTTTIEGGRTYTAIFTGYDRPPLIIDETTFRQPSGDAPTGSVTVVDTAPEGEFEISLTNGSGDILALERITEEYFGSPAADKLFKAAVGGKLDVVKTNSATGEVVSTIPIYMLPNTHVLLNTGTPGYVNYSTGLSVADWLAGINEIPAAPVTFKNFVETATNGGFAQALNECEDYMWLAWTDAAFEALAADQQSAVKRSRAATVLNDSVLQPATTTPYYISPTATRGGTALEFGNPFDPSAAPPSEGLSGLIDFTLSTTGNGVQNVVHVIDTVPVFTQPRRFYLGAKLRF